MSLVLSTEAQRLYDSISIPASFTEYQREQLKNACARTVVENNENVFQEAIQIYINYISNNPQIVIERP